MLFKTFPFNRQLESRDCGPACLKMIASYYGKKYPLDLLRQRCMISKEGVSMLGISKAAESIGLRTLNAAVPMDNLVNEMPLPAIVHWQQKHFVVVIGADKKKLKIADPKYGIIALSHEEFQKNWISDRINGKDTGLVLCIEPSPAFYQQAEEKGAELKLSYFYQYFIPYKGLFMQLGVGMLVSSMLSLILPFLAQSIIDVGIANRDLTFIELIIVFQLFFNICNVVVDFIKSWILLHIGSKISISIISDFLIKLLALPYPFFEQKRIGDVLQRISDHKRIQGFLTSASLNIIFSIADLIIFGAILIYYNIAIFTIFMISNIIQFGWTMLFMKRRKSLDYRRFTQQSDNQSTMVQLLNGVQEIKLQNCERRKRWEWEKLQLKQFRLAIDGQKLIQIQTAGNFFIGQTKNIVISFIAASAVVHGDITLGMMLSISYIMGRLSSPLSQFSGLAYAFQDAKISLERLAEIHAKPNESNAEQETIDYLPDNKDIIFEKVSFRYNEFDYALQDISLHIPHGTKTAIVGLSGSGKSTLIKLLLKLYAPTSGAIRINSINLNNIDTTTWRQACGSVSQEGFLFNDSIANNIGISDDIVDRDKLIRSMELANVTEFVDKLPLSVNTRLGQDGNGLSSGQKQRLLIARAIYKDPDFIFLDEATNSLDAHNEKLIVGNLTDLFKARTVIIAAHRLSTVKSADQIIVLKKGRVIEKGTHETLIALKGEYYNLVKEQLSL